MLFVDLFVLRISIAKQVMKYLMAVVAIASLIFSCSPPHGKLASESTGRDAKTIRDSTNVLSSADGASYETAIVIEENTEAKGVLAEYDWIREHYKNYTVGMQSLNIHNKKYYDVISISFTDGSEKDIYFNISNFFKLH